MSSSEGTSPEPITIPIPSSKRKCTFKSKLLDRLHLEGNAGKYISTDRCANGCNIFRNKRDYKCPGCGMEVKYTMILPKLKYEELCELVNRFRSNIE